MRTVSVEEIYNWNCCWLEKADGESRLANSTNGVTTWSAEQVLDIENATALEKLWVVLRQDFLDPEIIHELLLYYGSCLIENAVDEGIYIDERLVYAMDAKEDWLTDQNIIQELDDARKDVLAVAYEADTQLSWRLAWAIHKITSVDESEVIEPFLQLAMAASNPVEQSDNRDLRDEITLAPHGEELLDILRDMILL